MKTITIFGILVLMVGVSSTSAQLSGTWIPTGNMNTPRYGATAALLNNGKVLVAGGIGQSYIPTASAELYDPSTGVWTPTAPMSTARRQCTATLLPNGKVLVAGGCAIYPIPLFSAELYDPSTGIWTPTGNMHRARLAPNATLLSNGLVLIMGGLDSNYATETSAELYDPATGLWSNTGSMIVSRYWDYIGSALLPNGSVLIVGGTTCCPYHWINEAEVYDPISQSWTQTSGKTTPANYSPVLLNNGQVLVAGGQTGTQPNDINVASAELFDSKTGIWTGTDSMSTNRYDHTLTLLPNGQVMAAGGYGGGWGVCHDLSSFEIYDPNTSNWSPTGSMSAARYYQTATVLPNGNVLIAAGIDCAGNFLSSAEIYTSGCAIPTGEVSSDLTNSSVKIKWGEIQGAEGYNIRYGPFSTKNFAKQQASKNYFRLENLLPDTRYEWQVRTDCNSNPKFTSNWSDLQYFTTLSSREGIVLKQLSVQVFPNPAFDATTIQFALPQLSNVRLSVYDLNGKEIKIITNALMQAGEHSLQLNTSKLPEGVYVVKMIYDGGVESKKLTVE